MSDNEDDNRQQEINMFAAMAAGDYSSGIFDSEVIGKINNEAAGRGSPAPAPSPETTVKQGGDPARSMFTQAAAAMDNSGTFNFTTPTKNGAGNHNLEAAAAALADPEAAPPPAPASSISLPSSQPNRGIMPLQSTPSSPMHAQQVFLPKPLFFGAVMPPRVLKEAREIVKEAIKEQKNQGKDQALRVSRLRPEVRNLISAIRTYGHGVSILPGEEQSCRGTPYVSVFAPAWGEGTPHPVESDTTTDSDLSAAAASDDEAASTSPTSAFPPTTAAESSQEVPEPSTSTGEPSGEEHKSTAAPALPGDVSERDLFSMWARGEAAEDGSINSAGSLPKKADSGSKSDDDMVVETSASTPAPMSDQDLFSQWARGESPSNSSSQTSLRDSLTNINADSSSSKRDSGTFLPVPLSTQQEDDSDDDSVVGSELKRKVGVNEHLNAALASLEEEWNPSSNDQAGQPSDPEMLTQVPLTTDGGRALTNLELMNGCTPLFGVDDSPLPVEADLGIHETKDEQQRSNEQRRNQSVIEKCVPQNIFGPIACPDPSLGPDDSHSWNSRSTPSQILSVPTSAGGSSGRLGVLPTPEGPSTKRRQDKSPSGDSSKSGGRKGKTASPKSVDKSPSLPTLPYGRFDSRARYGWWNIPEEENTEKSTENGVGKDGAVEPGPSHPLQLPPMEHSSSSLLVNTRLEPSPEKLCEQNRPLSHLHAASSLAQTLPFLSDRPSSYRYLQVDTQAVGFPALGGEVEPLFCTLAIYNVETVPPAGNAANVAPMPDIQRCGRVTETLNFDVVSDPDVERRCFGSLWPHAQNQVEEKKSVLSQIKRASSASQTSNNMSPSKLPESERLQGTRCGVFPLPSNLNVSNLYVVLIVHKVISEGSDFEAYLRPGKPATGADKAKQDKIDLETLRSRAEKASKRQWNFLMPFAFGVAPLLQVFGADVPVVASSRAVQIPLFRFSAGLGERQIIDHIMVMLYPRADHRSSGIAGPAPVTNGGTAMLVMRNFGYLGLHSVVHSKSSLARDRLVDFTGEIQIRRRHDDDSATKDTPSVLAAKREAAVSGNVLVVPEWHSQFVAEPTAHGGRNAHADDSTNGGHGASEPSRSHLYAQELAPLPLQLTPSSRPSMPSSPGLKGQRGRVPLLGEDIEPFYHTSFCNELLCHPRLLHNCPKGNIVIKVEMREMVWKQEYNTYFAYIPGNGPSVHNPRRGPFLVQGAFTSCSSRCLDPHFLDEFKIKLPLELKSRRVAGNGGVLSLFFTAYRISFSSRKKWTRRLRTGTGTSKRTGRKIDDIAGDMAGESNEELDTTKSCRLIQLACGHLPIVSQSSLVGNGLHDVKMTYVARNPRRELSESGKMKPGTLILSEITEMGKGVLDNGRFDTDGFSEDGESVNSGLPLGDTASATSASDNMSESTEDWRTRQLKQKSEQIALQVRVVAHSSLHTQNSTLSEFFTQEPDVPIPLTPSDCDMVSFLREGRDEILHRLNTANSRQSVPKPRYEVDKLLISTIDLSNSSMCSISDCSGHLVRVILQLWKIIVSGTGEPDLAWANPASIIPLRVQSFATLLQLMGSSSRYFSKRGVTQLDGTNKWSIVSLGRVIALLFDEGVLFGEQAEEAFNKEAYASVSNPGGGSAKNPFSEKAENPKKAPTEKRRRHVRSKYEFFHNGSLESGEHQSSDDFLLGGTSSLGVGSSLLRRSGDDFKFSSRTMPAFRSSTDSLAKAAAALDVFDEKNETEDAESVSDKAAEIQTELGDFQPDVKVDSVSDFRSALQAGSTEMDGNDEVYEGPASSGASAAIAMIRAFSGNPVGSRRWMTAPSPNLATITEDYDGDGEGGPNVSREELPAPESRKPAGPLDSLDTELFLRPTGSSVKQMRVPKTKKSVVAKESNGLPSTADIEGSATVSSLAKPDAEIGSSGTSFLDVIGHSLALGTFDDEEPPLEASKPPTRGQHRKTRSQIVPTTDEEIESAGTAFLDVIGESLGLSGLDATGEAGEEKRVGQMNHKKSRTRCSIDWSLPNDDLGNALADVSGEEVQKVKDEPASQFDETMSTLRKEKELCIRLPNFADRLASLGKSENLVGRWFPFAYELIIMQWVAILSAQHASGDANVDLQNQSSAADNDAGLSEAASRTGGVIIACAPILFEIIKQSLGWRVANLRRNGKKRGVLKNKHPPLVTLDDALMANLERLVSMITDACLDSRNFDSWETRQTCIDVNDSIARFLRDLFAFLDPTCVHRLVLVFLSRFTDKEGKQWQDRDSSIGLRCSWEISKLQMNAITSFVRFPDFVKVNSPQMYNWGDWWTAAPSYSTALFFDDILDRFQKLSLPSFAGTDGGNSQNPKAELPRMRPHWLAEIVTDICILGTEHAENNIQQRAASLLHELFWSQSQQSIRSGNSSVVASMYVTFLEKVLWRTSYLSSFSPKSQLRKDIIPCVAFILQSAPTGILRAVWRRLFVRATGKGLQERYGGIGYAVFTESTDDGVYPDSQRKTSRGAAELKQEPDIFDLFSLLNLSLCTLEYEGSDDNTDIEFASDTDGPTNVWRKEFLLAEEYETADVTRRRRLMAAYGRSTSSASDDQTEDQDVEYRTSSSRKWHAHDGALVVINAAQQIVRELRFVLEPSEEGQSFFNPERRKARVAMKHRYQASLASVSSKDSVGTSANAIRFSYSDTVVFVRAATSVYLQSLTLRQSDIALIKTFKASVEIVKIFGIKIFNEAVGETLQHWMRVVSFHCGSRRAEVRVPASDFLELILRSTWESFGSFFRIRLPLLAVQTEVMERIVATAAARHYRDQRRLGSGIDLFSNGSAEASIAPLWRTLDRLHHQSASQNVAFRSALIRLAEKLKKLFRAYIAAHALSFLNRSRLPSYGSPVNESEQGERRNMEAETLVRANRISVHRVINASAGYSKQFLGFYSTSLDQSTVAHHEAVEDAFLDAADVFSPTELPDHRVAWLRKLAEFHSSRSKYAEEATCHFHIHLTLKQAAGLHGALWSSTPFLPWTDTMSDGIHLDGEGPAGDPDDYTADFDELPDINYGRQIDKTNSFRRIFYRVANSIRVNGGEWESGVSKYLFYGVTLASEYHTVSPWITLREMEASMLEEAEAAGDLFLRSGIIESSRYAWSLATQYYAEKFSYGKLAHVYERLSRTVVSQVPPIDSSLQQEVCIAVPLGRFYRVWFHGGAPDELIGAEFVYRTASNVKLEQFGKELREVIRCIIPDKTPIHLVLDGRPEENAQQGYTGFSRMAGAPLEPVRIKVTPLRPLVGKASRIRGLPEWFNSYIDSAFSGPVTRSTQANGSGLRRTNSRQGDGPLHENPHHRDHARSFSASVFSSGASSAGASASRRSGVSGVDNRRFHFAAAGEGELVGADKFSFIQPINKDRSRGARDWLKGASGDFAEKSLRVTQLQVGQAFPACVARQAVVHRVVFTQSPLEAGVDSICQWCTVLFRTAIATNGMAVLGINSDPGIGNDAAKVVADCIHSSRVKEMGLSLLKKNASVEEDDDDILQSYDRLGEDEVKKLQLKLSRSLVVFIEILHLLIARNRDLLLDVIQERKKGDAIGPHHAYTRSLTRGEITTGTMTSDGTIRSFPVRQRSAGAYDSASSQDGRSRVDESTSRSHIRNKSAFSDDTSMPGLGIDKARTDSAIAVQSELQRAFISLAKALHPMILGIMGAETPRWLKQCCQENYFSSYTYRQTKIPIGEELVFFSEEDMPYRTGTPEPGKGSGSGKSVASSADGGTSAPNALRSSGSRTPDSPGGSLGSSSAVSKGSEAARSFKSLKSGHSLV